MAFRELDHTCICNNLAGVKCGFHFREEKQQILDKQLAEQEHINSAYQRARAQSEGLLTNVAVPGYEEKYTAPSGATSRSKAPDYTLCPSELEEAAVERFQFGIDQPNGHAKGNWQKGKDDPVFIKERMNHLKKHLTLAMNGNGTWEDFQAVVCNAAMICWWRKNGTGLFSAFPNLGPLAAVSRAVGLAGGDLRNAAQGIGPSPATSSNAGSPAVGRGPSMDCYGNSH